MEEPKMEVSKSDSSTESMSPHSNSSKVQVASIPCEAPKEDDSRGAMTTKVDIPESLDAKGQVTTESAAAMHVEQKDVDAERNTNVMPSSVGSRDPLHLEMLSPLTVEGQADKHTEPESAVAMHVEPDAERSTNLMPSSVGSSDPLHLEMLSPETVQGQADKLTEPDAQTDGVEHGASRFHIEEEQDVQVLQNSIGSSDPLHLEVSSAEGQAENSAEPDIQTDSKTKQTEQAFDDLGDEESIRSERERRISDDADETFSDAEYTESDMMESESDMPSLRPKVVPQAPRNFTQFIMDEHDDCELFIDFDKGYRARQGEGRSVSNSVRDQEYFDQDFQNVYQSTRETEANELPRETLIERILEMREKVKVLHDQLAEREENAPQNILNKLHAELLELQEENKKLRNTLGPCKIHKRRTVSRSTSVSSNNSSGQNA